MPHTTEQLKLAIEAGIPSAVAIVDDTKGTGDHFNAVVISQEFEGKSSIDQQRMVHRTLKEIIEGDLHALNLKTFTPAAAERAGITVG